MSIISNRFIYVACTLYTVDIYFIRIYNTTRTIMYFIAFSLVGLKLQRTVYCPFVNIIEIVRRGEKFLNLFRCMKNI